MIFLPIRPTLTSELFQPLGWGRERCTTLEAVQGLELSVIAALLSGLSLNG